MLALLASVLLPTGALAAPLRAIASVTLDSTGDVGRYSSLALDAQSRPVIAYYDTSNQNLKLVYCDDPACSTSTIRTVDSTGNAGQWPSLKLNSQGNPVIAYWITSGGGTALKLIVCSTPTCQSGTVTIRTLDTTSSNNTLLHPSLQLDIDGNPVVSYTRSTNPGTGIWLAYCDDPTCATHQLNQVLTLGTRRYSSLQLDSSGYPVIAYTQTSTGYLGLVHCSDPYCVETKSDVIIQTGTAEESEGGGPSMVLNASGNPVIVYKRATGTVGTWLVTCNDPNCSSTPTQNMISSARAFFPSLQLNSAGNPRFTYYNSVPNTQVVLASCTTPTCSSGSVTNTVIVNAGSPGQTSLALDCNSNPVISYYLGSTSLDLRLAHETGATSCAHFDGNPTAAAGPLAFEAARGDSSQLTIDVENDGAAGSLLNVDLASITSGYTVSGLPINGLATTDSAVTLTVECTSAPSSAGTLVLTTNNLNQATVTYRLTCAETPPHYTSSPAPGPLALVGVRSNPVQQALSISNTGDPGSLLDVSQQSISSGYTVSGLPIVALATTDPAASLTVECTSAPSAAGTLVLATNDLTQPTLTYSLTCAEHPATFDGALPPPGPLAFSAPTGKSTQLTIDINNLGHVDSLLDVSLVSISSGYSILSSPLPVIALSTTATLTLNVQCDSAPQAAGTLVLATSDLAQPTVTYNLTCDALESLYDANPMPGAALAFDGALGSSPQLSIVVSNSGDAGSELDVSLASLDAGYSIVSGLPIDDLLTTASPATIVVQCTKFPQAAGTLVLASNDPAQPTITYPLSCGEVTSQAAAFASASKEIVTSGVTVLHFGRLMVSIPANAIPPGQTGCQVTAEQTGFSGAHGFLLDDNVWDVKILCDSGELSILFAPVSICIQPADGVANNKQVFHSHAGGAFSALAAASGPASHVCGETRIFSLFTLNQLALPATGFAPGRVSALVEPAVEYAATDLYLSIPKLSIQLDIVGVPQGANGWDVAWLASSQAGYLYGTSFPTWQGNSVLTAHVWNADNTPGPFYQLRSLQHGDRFTVAYGGHNYVYEVRSNQLVLPSSLRPLAGSDYSLITLITCESFDDGTGQYRYRRAVQAVLVEVD